MFKVGDKVALIDPDLAWAEDPEIFTIIEIEQNELIWYINKVGLEDCHYKRNFRKLTALEKALK